MGGSLNVVDVVIIDRYHGISDEAINNPKEAERFWYARGRGWIRWDHFKNRTTGQWNASDPATMLKLGRELEPNNVQSIWFKNDSPQNNNKIPRTVCSGGVKE